MTKQIGGVAPGICAFVHRAPVANLGARLEVALFWYMFSTEAAAATERARMDAVHESRASRRLAKAAGETSVEIAPYALSIQRGTTLSSRDDLDPVFVGVTDAGSDPLANDPVHQPQADSQTDETADDRPNHSAFHAPTLSLRAMEADGTLPGPCSSSLPAPFLSFRYRCTLRAGHAGDHECVGPAGAGYARWAE